MNFIIPVALNRELTPLRQHLSAVFAGEQDVRLIFKKITPGFRQPAEIGRITGDVAINAGTAGAIDEMITPLQTFLASSFINHQGQIIDQPELFHNYKFLETLMPVHWQRGRLLTVSEPVLSARTRQQFQTGYQAAAVDMEAFTVARYCLQKKMSFLSLKVISDTADSETLLKFKQNLDKAIEILSEQLVILIKILQENQERMFLNG
ncbi:MAG: hypothetical protein ACP5FZ_09445 [Fidelibacterota bacterium]